MHEPDLNCRLANIENDLSEIKKSLKQLVEHEVDLRWIKAGLKLALTHTLASIIAAFGWLAVQVFGKSNPP